MTIMDSSPIMETAPVTSRLAKAKEAADNKAIDFDNLSEDDKQRIATWVKGEYTRIKSARRKIENQWYLNMSFYYGRQNAVLAQQEGLPGVRLTVPKAPYWRSRPVFNKIRPAIRTELAKLTSQKPTVEVIPASSDETDLAGAEAATQLWDAMYRQLKIQSTLREAAWWTLITGCGYVKTIYDPSAPDTLAVGEGIKGAINVIAETPFNVFVPDFRQQDLEKQPYLIHATVKSVEWVNQTYKDRLNGEKVVADVKGSDDILSAAFLDLDSADDIRRDGCLVFEAWIKPGNIALFPEGALITVVGGKVIQASKGIPYENGEYPFAKIDHIPKGQFYSDSTITDLIPVQREYNRTRGQIIEAKNRMAKPQLIAPLGSIDPSKITTEPGQVILYKPGFAPPQPLPLQPLPAYVIQEIERLNADFDDISGQHEVTRGQVPPGVTAATAISYLQEQDDTKLSHTVESIEQAVEKVARQIITLAVQFWDTRHIIKIVGADNSFNTIVLKGSDLRNSTDIRVESGSALATSKAAKQAFIMDLMKMGFIDPNIGLQLLEMGGVASLYENIKLDESQAQRENIKMQTLNPELFAEYQAIMGQLDQTMDQDPVTGQFIDPNTGELISSPALPIPVNDFDDHGKHIEVHNKFRKSQTYEALSDETKALFDAHVKAHVEALIQSYMPGNSPMAGMGSSIPSEVAGQDNGGMVQQGDPNNPQADPSMGTQAPGDTLAGNPDAQAGGQLPGGGV